MAKLIKGVHHIALKCKGVDAFNKTVTYYRDVLGMEPVRSWGTGDNLGIMLSTGDAMMEIFSNAPDELGLGTIRHFALRTDDVDACVAASVAYGCDVITEPNDIVIAAEKPFPARIAFVHGPVGEEIEFFCEK